MFFTLSVLALTYNIDSPMHHSCSGVNLHRLLKSKNTAQTSGSFNSLLAIAHYCNVT